MGVFALRYPVQFHFRLQVPGAGTISQLDDVRPAAPIS